MVVAHVITRGDVIGGAQMHVMELSRALEAKGHRSVVVAGGGGRFFRQLCSEGIECHVLQHLGRNIDPMRDVRALVNLVQVLKKVEPDLIATHTSKAGLLGRVAARMLRVPVVFTPHGWTISDRLSRRQGQIYVWVERMAATLSDRIINVCHYERRLALSKRIASEQKLPVVYNGLPDVEQEWWANPAAQPPVLVMTARFEHPKDHFTLLKALSSLKHYPWSLLLLGEGKLETAMCKLAMELNLSSRVSFLGDRDDVKEILSRAQILVLSSKFEAFPLCVLEGMRARLPVIATDVGGTSEAVVHNHTGLLVPPGNVEALSVALELLVTNPQLRLRMGSAGRKCYKSEFTVEKMLHGTLNLYQSILEEREISYLLRAS